MDLIRVILVEDHRLVRQGLRMMLESEPDLTIVGEAENGREAMELIRETKPDVAIMDMRMPELNGIECTRLAVEEFPGLRVIFLCAEMDGPATASAFRAGAVGYVPKTCAFEEVVQAIRTVVDGKIYISPSAAGTLVGSYLSPRSHTATNTLASLSNREREVLQLLAEGKSTKQIARELSIGVKTAESHRRNLMGKLKIDSVAQLTKLAIREQLTSL